MNPRIQTNIWQKFKSKGGMQYEAWSLGDEVKETTKNRIFKVGNKKKGGHILASSNNIYVAVPPENFIAMVETPREFDNYSLKFN